MQVKCECGEVVDGDTCMICAKGIIIKSDPGMAKSETKYVEVEPGRNRSGAAGPTLRGDGARLGRLGSYLLDITESIRIMDGGGNTIYNIPFGDAECTTTILGALRIRHAGKTISIRGSGAKAWGYAISYLQNPPVWYLRGSEDCEVRYGGVSLGVTPCVVTPPFSWDAFESGSYELSIHRPGADHQRKVIRASSGTHTIHYPDGSPAERAGGKPEGETLVLNPERSLVLGERPCLTDGRGVVVLRMPGAEARIAFLKRGATITWDQPGLGRLSVDVKCDSKLKYDRLSEMLPPRPAVQAEPVAATTPAEAPPADMQQHEQELTAQNTPAQPAQPEPKKKSWFSWGRKPKGHKWNRGTFEGTDLCVTSNDLDTRMGRLDGYAFEAVMANLLAAMNYQIEKGYDAKSGRMLGQTKSDMGVDVLATKGKDRVVVQCKHWKEQCGGPDVSKTIGAASTNGGTSVLMICTGGFSQQAFEIARQSSMPVELWGWETIRKNLRRHLLK